MGILILAYMSHLKVPKIASFEFGFNLIKVWTNESKPIGNKSMNHLTYRTSVQCLQSNLKRPGFDFCYH